MTPWDAVVFFVWLHFPYKGRVEQRLYVPQSLIYLLYGHFIKNEQTKKLANEIGASQLQLSHVFNRSLISVYYVPCSLQGNRTERARKLTLSPILSSAHDVRLFFLNTPWKQLLSRSLLTQMAHTLDNLYLTCSLGQF